MRMKSKWILAACSVLAVSLAFFAARSQTTAATVPTHIGTFEGKTPKYVFLFIGDGMSYPQITTAEMYLGKRSNLTDMVGGGGIVQLNFSKFPVAGAAQTFDSTSFIPDSASTATSLASGHKTLSGVINMDVAKSVKYTPISETLAKSGYKVGIVTSVPLNHATPAAFYAKAASRNSYYDIAKQIGDTQFDYYGGGGFLQPKGSDNLQPHIYDYLEGKGYTIVETKEEIKALDNTSEKVIAINPDMSVDGTAIPYEIDRPAGELSLADFVKEGIEVLDNDKGFFMMVEGGKIDWANHANDAASSVYDTIAFSQAVTHAINFYNEHPDETLILVTGDHETGGLTIGFAATGYSTFFEKMNGVTTSYEVFDNSVVHPYVKGKTPDTVKLSDLYDEIKANYGLLSPTDADAASNPGMVLTQSEITKLEEALKQSAVPAKERKYGEQEDILYGTYEPFSVTLSHIINNKCGITFSTYSHSGLPVPVYALGVGQELFSGFYDNTDVYKKMAEILGIN